MFRGANSINVDSKGRIAIPAKYRDNILESCNSNMIMTCDPYENCLLIFTLDHWEKTEASLQALSNSNKAHRALRRIMLGFATEVDMDSNGRLLVPVVLRDRAKLTKEAMLVGQGKTFQLWNEAEWNRLTQQDFEILASDELDSSELPDLFY